MQYRPKHVDMDEDVVTVVVMEGTPDTMILIVIMSMIRKKGEP